MGFRSKPAGVVESALGEGSLDLLTDCRRAAAVAGGPFKFTVTSPYMLSRTLLDHHYRNFRDLTLAVADVLAAQMPGLPAACVQVDEANIPGNPADAPLAAEAMNRVLDAISPRDRARRPLLFRQLRRPGHPSRQLESPHLFPQLPPLRPPCPRARPPPHRRPRSP